MNTRLGRTSPAFWLPNVSRGGYRNDPCLSVCASICPLVHLRLCSCNSSFIFHRIDLKFHMLVSYDNNMKIWIWFSIFISAIFDGVMALTDLDFDRATPATSLIELI